MQLDDKKINLLLSSLISFQIDINDDALEAIESLAEEFEKNSAALEILAGAKFKFLIPNIAERTNKYITQIRLLNELYDVINNKLSFEIGIKDMKGSVAEQVERLFRIPQIKGTNQNLLPKSIKNSNDCIDLASQKDMKCFIEYIVSAENNPEFKTVLNIQNPIKIRFTHKHNNVYETVALNDENIVIDLFLDLLYKENSDIIISIEAHWLENLFFAKKMREAYIENLNNPSPARIISLAISPRNNSYINFTFLINNNLYLKSLSLEGFYDLSDIKYSIIAKLTSVTLGWE